MVYRSIKSQYESIHHMLDSRTLVFSKESQAETIRGTGAHLNIDDKPVACRACWNTGILGRRGSINQLVPVSDLHLTLLSYCHWQGPQFILFSGGGNNEADTDNHRIPSNSVKGGPTLSLLSGVQWQLLMVLWLSVLLGVLCCHCYLGFNDSYGGPMVVSLTEGPMIVLLEA